MAEQQTGRAPSGRLKLAGWPSQFESDLDRIPWLERGRPRSFLEFRLLDMEDDQRIFPNANQEGRLGMSHYLYRWEWRLIGSGKVPVWFTLDGKGIITPIMAYSTALRSRRGERALAIARARQIHGIAAMNLTEID
jgi:hypothetical protein